MCSPVINILRKCGLFSTIENPITREKTEAVGSVVVDDANLYSGGFVGDTMSDVMKYVTKQGRAWASLLKIMENVPKQRKISGIWWIKSTRMGSGVGVRLKVRKWKYQLMIVRLSF